MFLTWVGFLELSGRLESFFSGLRKMFLRFAMMHAEERQELWPPHKHIKKLAKTMFQRLPVTAGAPLAIIWVGGGMPYVVDVVSNSHWLIKISIVMGLIIFLILNKLFAEYVLSYIISTIALIIEKFFALLAMPPSGVTGSIGLIITLISFIFSRIAFNGV